MLLEGTAPLTRSGRPTQEGRRLAPADRIAGLGGIRRAASLIAAVAAALVAALALSSFASANTINVTTTADAIDTDGDCSLREAVNAAAQNSPQNECPAGEAGPGVDRIVLAATTYGLTGAAGDDANVDGDLDILARAGAAMEGPLTISGQGGGATTIDGQGNDRVVHLKNGVLKVEDLTVTGGFLAAGVGFGGGIHADGTPASGELTLEDATVSGNTAHGGGGISVSDDPTSSLTLTRATLTNNTADGGVSSAGDGGGAKASAGDEITITDSVISGNTVAGTVTGARGGGLSIGGDATITGSTISDNEIGDDATAVVEGGNGAGLEYVADGTTTLTIFDTAISGNATERNGGGIFVNGTTDDPTIDIDQSTIEMNTAGFGGGGIYADDATLELDLTRVSGNSLQGNGTSNGGGIRITDAASTATITDSVVADNTSGTTGAFGNAGGGINNFAGTLTVRRSTISGNDLVGGATQHGGGYAQGGNGTSFFVNTTISGNTAPDMDARGGGILNFNSGGSVKLINVTVEGNTAGTAADDGDGVANLGGGLFSFANTIVDQPADDCETGTYTSDDNNISSDPTSECELDEANDLTATDPLLGPLADNGGPNAGRPGSASPLRTHALDSTSPAIEHVPFADCIDETPAPLTDDERGFARPFNVDCDSGAFEYRDSDGDGIEDGVDPFPFGDPPPPAPAPAPAAATPSNTFDFGKLKRKKKKGIAFVIAFVPGPGQVGLAGKGIKNRGLASTAATKSVFTDGGRVKLKVKPTKKGKGKKIRNRLRTKGKAKVKVFVSYLPTGGTVNTQKKKLKLVRE